MDLNQLKEKAQKVGAEFSEKLDGVEKKENKRLLAGLLGIFLGAFGVHKFVLGYTKEGIIQIILSVVSCGFLGMIGFCEGVVYLMKSDEEFYQTYQVGRKPWF